jgi:hypothetical protein
MAKKIAKKVTVRRSSKSAAATKGRQSAKKPAAKKPARAGGSHVSFGVHGMTNIVKAVSRAGLESEFNKALKHDEKFVRIPRKSLAKIKKFVASKPKLGALHRQMQQCDCPPDDPYCIYI